MRLLWPLAGAIGLAGCATPLRVEPLATGQPDTAAYQLFGPNLGELRAEARRLCPQGAQVLRSAEARHHRSTPSEPSAGRWVALVVDSVAPVPGSAQLMVVCEPVPGQDRLAALPPPAAKPSTKPAGSALDMARRGAASIAAFFKPKPAASTTTLATPSAPGASGTVPGSLPPVTGYDE